MPRGSRIDAANAVHHIMVRVIEQRKICNGDTDRDYFLHRLGEILQDTETTCFSWSLMPNHFHLLLRTGNIPTYTVMGLLLTGYAIWYNRSHRREDHLFQRGRQDLTSGGLIRSIGGWKELKLKRAESKGYKLTS